MLHSTLEPVLEKWFRYEKETEFYIINGFEKPFMSNFLSKKFKEALEKAKLKIKTFKTVIGQQRYAYSFHTLRHMYANYLLKQGIDLYYVQRSLGHTDIHTTQIYVYISNKDLQNKSNITFGKKQSQKKYFEKIEDPLQLLKLKFASGELSEGAFEEKYLLLQELENVLF